LLPNILQQSSGVWQLVNAVLRLFCRESQLFRQRLLTIDQAINLFKQSLFKAQCIMIRAIYTSISWFFILTLWVRSEQA